MERTVSPQLLAQLRNFFSQQPAVTAVYLFGSYGTEYEHHKSDIDLGVIFSLPLTLSDELEIDARLSLNVTIDREIDFVNLNCAPISLQYRALREGLLVHEGNYLKHSDFIEQVLKSHFEYQLNFPEYGYFTHEEEMILG
ncbi:type VII toxin-antitoxin system MntA family adenylyltransferase antitoxin [Desulfitobacterium sp. AusDCA]|uniref:type VII toxin-antitoxin system MntA family adenylyltransferase antitoxin n=1 Tax=Desulfitobacterium sp. AusDCA TaxID=3240383 RepID=UPI003DA74330